MAPKRKSRVSQTASPAPAPAPTPSRSNQTVAVEIEQRRRPKPVTDSTPNPKATDAEPEAMEEGEEEEEYDEEAANAALVADPWTDDEEIGLFKGLIHSEDDEERDSSPPLDEDLVPRPDSPPVRFTPSFEIALEEQTPSTRASKSKSAASVKGKGAKPSLNTRRSSRVADSVDPDDDGNEEEEEGSEGDEGSEQESMASGTPAPKVAKSKGRERPLLRSPGLASAGDRRCGTVIDVVWFIVYSS
ncbi:unnamed protein product [Aureobasidium pullulans]|nr:unnamed protein product [Aureobasidium pullulans]